MASTTNEILTLTEYFCRIKNSKTNKGKGSKTLPLIAESRSVIIHRYSGNTDVRT